MRGVNLRITFEKAEDDTKIFRRIGGIDTDTIQLATSLVDGCGEIDQQDYSISWPDYQIPDAQLRALSRYVDAYTAGS
jgi:hypothetical protein